MITYDNANSGYDSIGTLRISGRSAEPYESLFQFLIHNGRINHGEWLTICGTGTKDYFGGAWNFEHPQGQYGLYSTPFLGLSHVVIPDGLYRSQQRFGMYRWHIMDPVRFPQALRVTIQALGWSAPREDHGRYLPLQDDIASTAFWYQMEPHAAFG